jgi:hypothetical protein
MIRLQQRPKAGATGSAAASAASTVRRRLLSGVSTSSSPAQWPLSADACAAAATVRTDAAVSCVRSRRESGNRSTVNGGAARELRLGERALRASVRADYFSDTRPAAHLCSQAASDTGGVVVVSSLSHVVGRSCGSK